MVGTRREEDDGFFLVDFLRGMRDVIENYGTSDGYRIKIHSDSYRKKGTGDMASKAGAGAAAATGPKVVKAIVSLMVPSCKAAPSPAIGQALGALGVNMMEFCKAFNKRTEGYIDGVKLPVKLTAYTDRTFEFVTKSPTVAYLLKKAAGIELGSGEQGKKIVGEVSVHQIYEIAKLKQKDAHLSHISLEGLARSAVHTAHTCGIRVVNTRIRDQRLKAQEMLEEAGNEDAVKSKSQSKKKL